MEELEGGLAVLARIGGRRAYKGRTVGGVEVGSEGARVRGGSSEVIVHGPVPSCPVVAVLGFAVEVLMRCAVLAVLLLGACDEEGSGGGYSEADCFIDAARPSPAESWNQGFYDGCGDLLLDGPYTPEWGDLGGLLGFCYDKGFAAATLEWCEENTNIGD